MLQGHAENCAAVSRAHLTQLIGLMSAGSARYAWYLEVLFELTRGLDRGNARTYTCGPWQRAYIYVWTAATRI